MNLNMPRSTILSLCARGHAAAVALQKFDFSRHREIRYCTAMGQLDRAAHRDARCLRRRATGASSRLPRVPPRGLDRERRGPHRSSRSVGRNLATAAKKDPKFDFTRDDVEPRPLPDLRVVAHL